MSVPRENPGPVSRRGLLRLTVGGGLAMVGLSGVAACGTPGGSTTTSSTPSPADPLAPPSPIRTPTANAPVHRVVALSSADLDVLVELGRDPVAAWAVDGTGPRPWRDHPAPPVPEWDGPGLPSLRSLLPFDMEALAIAAADVSLAQLRGYERMGTVIVDARGRPRWRDHLQLMADAVEGDPSPAAAATKEKLDAWARDQRRRGVEKVVVVLGTGARPDTPVATLAADSPLGVELRELGFEVGYRPEPTSYREFRRRGVLVVRVDPRDDDLVAAVRQPSVSSLPWALERLVRARRPA